MSGIAEKERAEIVKMLKAEVRKMRAGAREYAKARTIGGYAVAASMLTWEKAYEDVITKIEARAKL